jgi:hypothetical protein
MTSWLIGHYHIWKAAVAGTAVNSLTDWYTLTSSGRPARSAPWFRVKNGLSGDQQWLSRPVEFHHQPLAEPDLNVSAHPAPIKQTLQSYRCANVQRDPRIPSQAVEGTDPPEFCGV